MNRRKTITRAVPISTLALLMLLQNCKKSDSTNNSALPPQEAAAQVSQSLSLDGGIGAQIKSSAIKVAQQLGNNQSFQSERKSRFLNAPTFAALGHSRLAYSTTSTFDPSSCGKSIIDSSSTNGIYYYDTFKINCNNGSPQSVAFSAILNLALKDTSGVTYKISFSDIYTINNLQDSVKGWVFAGKIADTVSNNSTTNTAINIRINYDYSAMSFDPNLNHFTSGTCNFSFVGSNSKGNFNYTGSVTFTADGNETITINGGAYKYDQQTGQPKS